MNRFVRLFQSSTFFHSHLAEVLEEGHHEEMAVDGGLDGGAFGNALHMSLLYLNGMIPIIYL